MPREGQLAWEIHLCAFEAMFLEHVKSLMAQRGHCQARVMQDKGKAALQHYGEIR
jgi:hypothetical protein